MKLTRKQLLAYFQAVLPFCNKRKVAELLDKCNVDTEVTPENCLSAYETRFTLFAPQFGRIAKTATQSNKFNTYVKAIQGEIKNGQFSTAKANGLSDAANKFVISGATDYNAEQKLKIGLGVIDLISDTIATGRDWINQSKEEADADARRAAAEAELEANKSKAIKAWVWPVTIATIALFGMVIFVIARNKK